MEKGLHQSFMKSITQIMMRLILEIEILKIELQKNFLQKLIKEEINRLLLIIEELKTSQHPLIKLNHLKNVITLLLLTHESMKNQKNGLTINHDQSLTMTQKRPKH